MSLIFGMFDYRKSLDHQDVNNMIDRSNELRGEESCVYRDERLLLGYKKRLLTPQDKLESQPIVSVRGRYIAVVDGRLDDRARLVHQLEIAAHQVEDITDGTLVLKAYEKWGKKCTDHLLGDFAMAIFDQEDQSLWCAKDHLGASQFFYAIKDSCFYFGSLPLFLTATKAIGKSINYKHVASYLALLSQDETESCFKGVYDLRTGHSLHFGSRGISLAPYWKPDLNYEMDASVEECTDRLRELLEQAVSDRLRVDKSISSMLSGGLDSSTISCMAAKKLQEKNETLSTFTYVPIAGFEKVKLPGAFANERPYVEEVVRFQPGLKPRYINLKGASIFDDLSDFLELSGGLYVSSYYNILWIERFAKEAAKEGATMMFTGQMGNFTISHTGVYYGLELARKGRFLKLFKWLNLRHRISSRLFWLKFFSMASEPFTPASIRTLLDVCINPALKLGPFYKKPFLRQFKVNPLGLKRKLNQLKYDRPAREYMLSMNNLISVGYKAYEEQYGIRMLDPCMDKRVYEYTMAIPLQYWSHMGNPRFVIRKLTEGLLPDKVRLEQKKGRQLVDHGYLIARDKGRILAHIKRWEKIPEITKIFNFQEVSSRLKSFEEHHYDPMLSLHLSKVVAVSLFIEQNLE